MLYVHLNLIVFMVVLKSFACEVYKILNYLFSKQLKTGHYNFKDICAKKTFYCIIKFPPKIIIL